MSEPELNTAARELLERTAKCDSIGADEIERALRKHRARVVGARLPQTPQAWFPRLRMPAAVTALVLSASFTALAATDRLPSWSAVLQVFQSRSTSTRTSEAAPANSARSVVPSQALPVPPPSNTESPLVEPSSQSALDRTPPSPTVSLGNKTGARLPTQPAPASVATSPTGTPTLSEHLTFVVSARDELAHGNFDRVTRLERDYAQFFPGGPVAEEMRALAALALCQGSNDPSRARAFVQAHPGSVFTPRVMRECGVTISVP